MTHLVPQSFRKYAIFKAISITFILSFLIISVSDAKTKVGVFLPMHTTTGQRLWTSITMAVNDAQNTDIELIPYDTQFPLTTLVKKAKQDHVTAIIGPLYGENLNILKPLLFNTHIPVFSLSNKSYYAGKGFWLFGYNLADQIIALNSYLKQQKITQLLVLFPKNEYGYTLSNFLTQYQGANTFIISKSAFYGHRKSQYSNIIKNLLNTDVRSKTIQANLDHLEFLYKLKRRQTNKRVRKLITNIKTIMTTININSNTESSPPPAQQVPAPKATQESKNALSQQELTFIESMEHPKDISADMSLDDDTKVNTESSSDLPWYKLVHLSLPDLKNWITSYKNNPTTDNLIDINILLIGDNSSEVRALSEISAFLYKTPSKIHFFGLAAYENMPLLSSEPSMFGAKFVTAKQTKSLLKFKKQFYKLTHTPANQIDAIAYMAMNTFLTLQQSHNLKTLWNAPLDLSSLNGPMRILPNGQIHYAYNMLTINPKSFTVMQQQ